MAVSISHQVHACVGTSWCGCVHVRGMALDGTLTVRPLPQNWELREALEHKSNECEELTQELSKLQQLVKRPTKIPVPSKVPLVHNRRSYHEAVSEGCLCTVDEAQTLSDKGEPGATCL